MALRGNGSQSFLRSKELLSFSEIAYDTEGNYILDKEILKEALSKDENGNFIRNKANIAKILNKYGVIYRMIFNAMNMEQYSYEEVEEAVSHLASYINDLGVSGIVEFHAADKTQNSDHIHFWINSEEKLIYHKIALEMVNRGYSNKEDVYIQKYETNEKIEETEYVNTKDYTIEERFSLTPLEPEPKNTSFLQQKSTAILERIHALFDEAKREQALLHDTLEALQEQERSFLPSTLPQEALPPCSLPDREESQKILLRIQILKYHIDKRSTDGIQAFEV